MGEKMRLGDFVERVIEKTMPKAAKRAKESGCGCGKKKAKLNELDKLIRG